MKKDKYEVTYSGGQETIQAMLDKITTMNYFPSVEDAIATKASTFEASFQSKTKAASTAPGKKGQLVVGIFPNQGQTLGGKDKTATVVKVTGPEGVTFKKSEETISEALKKRKLVTLEFSAAKGAKSGDVTVEVIYEAGTGGPQKATFTVPVKIE